MFLRVELEYPCFDTDLISSSSMTKGKKVPGVSSDVFVYLIHLVPLVCHAALESQG